MHPLHMTASHTSGYVRGLGAGVLCRAVPWVALAPAGNCPYKDESRKRKEEAIPTRKKVERGKKLQRTASEGREGDSSEEEEKRTMAMEM